VIDFIADYNTPQSIAGRAESVFEVLKKNWLAINFWAVLLNHCVFGNRFTARAIFSAPETNRCLY
jgi:hypothetical protein